MPDDNPHLRSMLRNAMTAVEPPPMEEEAGLPPLNGRQYTPHSRPANKPLYSLHILSIDGKVHSFQYVHLDSQSTYTSECITLKFMGMEPVRVCIYGRNLWLLYDYLHQHRIAWVMQAPRDFAQDRQTIVTHVTFAAVKLED